MKDKITVLHNNSCSKSRAILEFLDENGVEFEVLNFIDQPLTVTQLQEVITKLGCSVHDIIRKNEPLFKENFEQKSLSDEEWVDVLVKNPSLIQRPILVKGSFAVLGRSVENTRKIIEI